MFRNFTDSELSLSRQRESGEGANLVRRLILRWLRLPEEEEGEASKMQQATKAEKIVSTQGKKRKTQSTLKARCELLCIFSAKFTLWLPNMHPPRTAQEKAKEQKRREAERRFKQRERQWESHEKEMER